MLQKQKLNIFAVGAYPPSFGGGEQAGWNIAKQLARQGHKITIFTEAVPGRTVKLPKNVSLIQVKTKMVLSKPNVETFNLVKPLRQIVGFGGGIAKKPFIRAVRKELANGKPDAILVNFGVPHLAFMQRLAMRYNIPLISVFHGSDVHNLTKPEFRKVKNSVLKSYKRPDAKIAVSNYLKRTLEKMGVNGVTVIPNAIDLFTFKPVRPNQRARTRAELNLPTGAVVLSHVSELGPIKRPLDIIEAGFQALKKAPNLHFLIVGDGPLKSKMIERAQKLGIGNRFTFTGMVNQKQVNLYLNASDALVLPSKREGMPLVILEAFACGKPVIASRVGGIPEIVRNGRNGLLVESGNTAQLANRMVLISGEALRQKLSKGAVDTAKGNTLETAAKQYYKVILNAAKRKAKQPKKRFWLQKKPKRK